VGDADTAADDGVAAPFGADEARRVLVAACGAGGLDPVGARLMRLGDHALFRLASVPVVARIGRAVAYADAAARELSVSAWLNAAGVPAVRAATSVEQPLVVDGRVVTFWEAAGSGDDYGTVTELAGMLRRMHRLEPPAGLGLPSLVPFGRTRRRLLDAVALGERDRRFLLDRVAELDDKYAGLSFALPVGPVHGDANVGNVLHDDAPATPRRPRRHHRRTDRVQNPGAVPPDRPARRDHPPPRGPRRHQRSPAPASPRRHNRPVQLSTTRLHVTSTGRCPITPSCHFPGAGAGANSSVTRSPTGSKPSR
jgi:hypothetical protein